MVILVYNALGKMKAQGLKVTDLAGNLTNVEQVVLATAPDNFGQYGVEINKISGLTISLPDEVQKAIDTRSQMQVLGRQLHAVPGRTGDDRRREEPIRGRRRRRRPRRRPGRGRRHGQQFGQAMMGGMGQQAATRSCPNCGSMIPLEQRLLPQLRRGADQSAAATAAASSRRSSSNPLSSPKPRARRQVLPQLRHGPHRGAQVLSQLRSQGVEPKMMTAPTAAPSSPTALRSATSAARASLPAGGGAAGGDSRPSQQSPRRHRLSSRAPRSSRPRARLR